MTDKAMDRHTRERILANPEILLDDPDVMRALVDARDGSDGKVVDLRSVAMDRLEARLDRLEDTHRTVIAAAYENLAGTNQIQRAILRMMDPTDYPAFLEDLAGDVAAMLRIDAIRLIREQKRPEAFVPRGDIELAAPKGFVDGYIRMGRNMPARRVTLRPYKDGGAHIFGALSPRIKSEGCLRLDLGADHLPALLLMGSCDDGQFTPQQGTDLLGFFTGVFERVLRTHLG